jgi:hypothetical protein
VTRDTGESENISACGIPEESERRMPWRVLHKRIYTRISQGFLMLVLRRIAVEVAVLAAARKNPALV